MQMLKSEKNLNKKIQMLRQDRGITLVALVTTIIVLLILAGITIGTVINEDGILGTTQNVLDLQNNYVLNTINGINGVTSDIANLIVPAPGPEPKPDGPIVLKSTTWSNGQATITLGTTSEYLIEYKVIDSESNEKVSWTKGKGINKDVDVKYLNHNDLVVARLTDGIYDSKETQIVIEDKEKPEKASIKFESNVITTGTSTTATIFQEDKQTGVDINNCKWKLTTSDAPIGTNADNYSEQFYGAVSNTATTSTNKISISATELGTYYVHVLTVDKVGNSIETVSNPIEIKQLVTGITLNKTEITLYTGENETLTATVKPDNASDKTVTWSSSNPEIATVDENGKVTAISNGTATIIATATDGSKVESTCKITVKVKEILVQSITLNPTTASIYTGETVKITATVAPSDATNKTINWSSSNTSVATVDKNGVVIGKTAGTVTITAKAKDGSKVESTCKITVNEDDSDASISLDKTSETLMGRVRTSIIATVHSSSTSNLMVYWESSNTSVASLDLDTTTSGEINYIDTKSSGTATITAYVITSEGRRVYAECIITVQSEIEVESITLNPETVEITQGETATIDAEIQPYNATDHRIRWSSNNTAVATVSSSGVVTGVSEGTATISATAMSGATAWCTVKVSPVTGTITLENTSWSGGKATITLKTTSRHTIEYRVLDKEFNVKKDWTTGTGTNGSVEVSDLNNGYWVDARLKNSAGYTSAILTTVNILDGIEPESATIDLNPSTTAIDTTKSYDITSGTTISISAKVTHADKQSGVNIKSCKWIINNSATALGTTASSYTGTFSSNGQTISKTVSKGTYYLHVLTVDNAGNATETVSGAITVIQKVTGITLDKTQATINIGGTTSLTATITPEDASNLYVNWTTSDSSIATISPNTSLSGKSIIVTAVKEGEVTITATAADGSGKTASCTVTVQKPVTGITLDKTSVGTEVGVPIYLTATISPSDASNLNVKWEIDKSTTYATLSETTTTSGKAIKITPKRTGTVTITATAEGDSTKTASCKIVIVNPDIGGGGETGGDTCNGTIGYAVHEQIGTCGECGAGIWWYQLECSGCLLDMHGTYGTCEHEGGVAPSAVGKKHSDFL